MPLPLAGIRVMLSGSIPHDNADHDGIATFVRTLASRVFCDGGTIVHGSHPTMVPPLREAALPYLEAGGRRDALVLVRSGKHAVSAENLRTVAEHRQFATVEIIPSIPGDTNTALVPMRDWLAERSDVVVAVGGRWYDVNRDRAGVPIELEASLALGKPGFVVAGYGGSTTGYLNDDPTLIDRLHNGLSPEANRDLATRTDPKAITEIIVAQLRRLPLLRGNTSSGRRFRILALDGGGLRGAFTAAVLAKWAEMMGPDGGKDLVKHFDLVAGTSTGSILAIGLGLGLTPRQILDFYRQQGEAIFPKRGWLSPWFGSKHESRTLRAILTGILKTSVLSKDSCCRLVIPTVRAVHGVAETITTAHSPDRQAFKDYLAIDAALASSAAPTYFDEAVVTTALANQSYLDGGIWANNPVLPAIAEAVAYLNVPLDRIDVLSVGTLGSELDFSSAINRGKAGWAPEIANLFFSAQESASARLGDALLTRARHLRVNEQTPTPIDLDNTAALEGMITRGENVGAGAFPAVRSRFLDGFHVEDWRKQSNPG